MNEKTNSRWILFALAISAFAIGSTEFISVGLLPMIQENLHTTLPLASLTVSIYAFGVVLGAPILTAVSSQLNPKNTILLVMIVFIIGNFISAIAPSLTILLIGRIIASLAHGVFMSVASVIAAAVVETNKRASALAFVFSGLTIATITGVPLGTFIGQITTWHMSFVFIIVIGLIGLISNARFLPTHLKKSDIIHLRDIFTVLKNGRMSLIFFITAIGYGGTFAVYTFLSPILGEKLHFSPHAIVIILVVYGIFVAIGNTIGGHIANTNLLKSLFIVFLVISIILLSVHFVLDWPVIALIMLFTVGLFMLMNAPGLQLFAVQIAEKELPKMILIASALNISAFNIGIAGCSYIGSLVVKYVSLEATPIVASIFLATAALIVGIWIMIERKHFPSVH